MILKTIYFLKKDFRLKKSYKFAFFWGLFSSFFSLLIFYYIDLLMERRITGILAKYGINYFNYVFIGLIIFNFTGAGPGTVAQKVYEEKYCGSLEEILAVKENIFPFLFSASLYNFLLSLAESVFYLLSGLLFFGVKFSGINIISMILILFFSFFSFSALGIFSACFTLLFKRGNPLAFLMNSAEGLLGGAYFPSVILPFGLYKISYALPVYWSIRAAQKAFYLKASPIDILSELFILAIFSITLFPLSLASFKATVRKTLLWGSLNQF